MPKMYQNSRTSSIRPGAPSTSASTKLAALLRADDSYTNDDDHPTPARPPPPTTSSTSSPGLNMSAYSSPGGLGQLSPSVDLVMWSPWNNLPPASPYAKSPWTLQYPPPTPYLNSTHTNNNSALVGSLVREQGHVYSLAASAGLLYTGSESKNVRVWCRNQEFAGFKSTSGLVKAIVVTVAGKPRLSTSSANIGASRRVFTGHQDGKIRVWASSAGSSSTTPGAASPEHRRVGSLPRLRDVLRGSLRPGNYVRVRRGRSALWMRHQDAVSCLCVSGDGNLLYSGSWDKTVKVWRLADSRCLESITAHIDAVNAVAASPPGLFFGEARPLLFTGSADGTVKAWRRDDVGDYTSWEHVLVQTLLKVDFAVTSLAVSAGGASTELLPALYAGSSDGMVNFWVSSKKIGRTAGTDLFAHAGTLRGHRLAVLCVVAAGGSLVLSGSADRTVCVWRREAEGAVHSCLSVLNGHQGPVKCLAVEADEEEEAQRQKQTWFVYSGSLDKSVKVWRVSDSADSNMGQQRHGLGYGQYSPLLQR